MSLKDLNYTLIETKEGVQDFLNENQNIEWMGFDTEFIGEKTLSYFTLSSPISYRKWLLFIRYHQTKILSWYFRFIY